VAVGRAFRGAVIGHLPPPDEAHGYRLVEMRDRLGNWVAVSYQGRNWVVTDLHGRTHRVDHGVIFGVGGAPRVTSVKVAKPGGGTATWSLGYAAGDVRASCKDTEPVPSPPKRFTVPLLTSVVLPDSSRWSMESYNTECAGGVKDAPGTLSRLRLPTRGLYEWDYQTYGFPNRGNPQDPHSIVYQEVAGVHRKRELNAAGGCDSGAVNPDCSWTYTWRDHLAGGEFSRATIVRTPLGDETVNYFSQKWQISTATWDGWDYGLPFRRGMQHGHGDLLRSQEIYDGPESGGTLLRSIYVRYEHDRLLGPNPSGIQAKDWHDSNRRLFARRTHYEDDEVGGVPRFTERRLSDFDGVGHHRIQLSTGDLGGSGSRTEITAYNPDRRTYLIDPSTNQTAPKHNYTPWPAGEPWVLGTYSSMRAEEPGSAIESEACFDAATGRLKRRRLQASSFGRGIHDVIVEHTRTRWSPHDIRYQVLTYGGDGQSVGTGSDLCSLTLPSTPVYRVRHTRLYGTLARTERLGPGGASLGLEPLDLTIDRWTGLPLTSTDPAGLVTVFVYDQLGRLTGIRPQSGGDAWTEIDYDAAAGTTPAQVTLRRRPNGSPGGPILEESRTVYDAFGRVRRDERRLPGAVGWTVATTDYNAMGWVTQVTSRGRIGGGLPHGTRYLGHDPFGRPTQIKPPDVPAHPGHDVTLDYDGIRSVSRSVSIATSLSGAEARFTTEERYDHLGRLWRVREPSGPGNSLRNTDYGYDAAGRLVSVAMHDGGFTQPRSFAYDGRGFLLSETHPENGTTVYSHYDALGHAGRKRTGPAFGPFDLGFTYDAAERLIEVREWGSGRRLKELVYGAGTSAADRSNGKIETAVRHNHVAHPSNGNPLDVVVTESYVYGGTGGRVSRRDTGLNTGQAFTQTWSYDDLGQVTLLGYPTCKHPGAACTGSPRPRTVGFTYQLGYLTAVPGYAGPITYHPNGMLAEIHHSNQVVYGQGLDPHWMRRPGSLWIAHPTESLSLVAGGEGDPPGTPHPYAYDGAGNVGSWSAEEYRYDGVSRILEGRLGAGETQRYGYDPLGNLLTLITDRGSGPQTTVLGVDRTTNRLSAATYDAAGNLTGRGGFFYQYDALSMMATMQGGGNRRTHIYTADDERIWTVEASTFPWEETFTLRDLDGKVLRVFSTDTGFDQLAWEADYVHRDGQLLTTARVAGGGETRHHFHLNHLGTPLLITNPQGGTEALHSYFPFGEELNPGVDSERMKYTGHERDLNQGGQADDLDYMHARYCSPLLGRFLSVDPGRGSEPTRPQSWNRYTYTQSNPLKYVDPDGEAVITATAVTAVIVVGVVATVAVVHHTIQMQTNPEYREAAITAGEAVANSLSELGAAVTTTISGEETIRTSTELTATESVIVTTVSSQSNAPGRNAPPPTAIPGQRHRTTPAPELQTAPDDAKGQPPQEEDITEAGTDSDTRQILKDLAELLGSFLG